MIRHCVLFRWRDGVDTGAVEAFTAGLAGMPAAVPVIRRYEFGTDLGLTDGSYDFGLVADFDDEDDYRAYSVHPHHQAFIEEHVRPNVAEAVRVQFRLQPAD